jgi:transposase
MKSTNDLEQFLRMLISDEDLRKLDDEHLDALGVEGLRAVSKQLCHDLKEARDRMNQNPGNSSRPPSTLAPWESGGTGDGPGSEGETPNAAGDEHANESGREGKGSGKDTTKTSEQQRRPPGRQTGAPGHGRKLEMVVTGEVTHRAQRCASCGAPLDESAPFTATTGFYVVDVEVGPADAPGLTSSNTKHLYGQTICSCGHVSATEPGQSPADPEWRVSLTERHLVGPTLASLIVCLAMRMRLSRARIQEFLHDWLGLDLSIGTLNRCIHEAGRAVAPVEDQLVKELIDSGHLHADETHWKESGLPLWLWVLSSAKIVLYLIGHRTSEIFENVLGDHYHGWVMSDGYVVYRSYQYRLRCWAHLKRKAQGLAESLDGNQAQRFGQQTLKRLKELMKAVYQAREGPPGVPLPEQYEEQLAEFKALCESHRDCDHKKTQALAREFLNDWEAIWMVLKHPQLPLTNNEAERALRHWVIARRISYGTRTEQGSRAFALLASVIETCRKRKISPWPYLTSVIAERRKGNDAPPLPAAAV